MQSLIFKTYILINWGLITEGEVIRIKEAEDSHKRQNRNLKNK
jgi:hypothetical protein